MHPTPRKKFSGNKFSLLLNICSWHSSFPSAPKDFAYKGLILKSGCEEASARAGVAGENGECGFQSCCLIKIEAPREEGSRGTRGLERGE